MSDPTVPYAPTPCPKCGCVMQPLWSPGQTLHFYAGRACVVGAILGLPTKVMQDCDVAVGHIHQECSCGYRSPEVMLPLDSGLEIVERQGDDEA